MQIFGFTYNFSCARVKNILNNILKYLEGKALKIYGSLFPKEKKTKTHTQTNPKKAKANPRKQTKIFFAIFSENAIHSCEKIHTLLTPRY